jgi:uncharacterized protein (TIGR02266 family)
MLGLAKRKEKEAERRVHPRAVLKTSVNLTSESNFYTGFSENISEGGVFISTYNPAPIGSKVDVEFSLPDGGPSIRTPAVVRWIREHNPAVETPPGLGLEFLELDERDQERVERFVCHREPLFYD